LGIDFTVSDCACDNDSNNDSDNDSDSNERHWTQDSGLKTQDSHPCLTHY
jgi:hypothetical protein